MAKIKGTHHIALKATNLDEYQKLVHFYHDILEMPIIRSWGEGEHLGMMVSTGDAMMELFSDGDAPLPQGAIQHLALATDDVDACIEAVRAEGYEITMEPRNIVISSEPPFPTRIAFCIGPVGEDVEFFSEQ